MPLTIPVDGLVIFKETVQREIRLMPNGERHTFARTVRVPVGGGAGEAERHSGEGMDTGDRRRAEDLRTAAAIAGGADLAKREARLRQALETRELWIRTTGQTPSGRLEKSWMQLSQDWTPDQLAAAMRETLAAVRDADTDTDTFSLHFIHLLRRWRREGKPGAPHDVGNPPRAER